MDDFDVVALDGMVELNLPDTRHVLNPSVAERLGVALLRAAGIADWKSTDDEAGTPFVVTDDEPAF
jgi:hypothetical protein